MTPRPSERCAIAAFTLFVAIFAIASCAGPLRLGARTVRTPVFKENQIRVFLRHRETRGEEIEMGFSHPRTISSIRLTRVLSHIDVRERGRKGEKGERKAAVSSDLAFVIGEGMSKALERASPNQEVVVMAVESRKRLGVFTADYLTSLVAWVKDDRLWLSFGEIDTRLSDDPTEKPKEPVRGKTKGTFRLVNAPGIRPVDPFTVAASWRDKVFSKPAPARTKAGERALRRTILMEEAARGGEQRPDSAGTLSPDTLRALADLEEQRISGELSEDEYLRQRRKLLRDDG